MALTDRYRKQAPEQEGTEHSTDDIAEESIPFRKRIIRAICFGMLRYVAAICILLLFVAYLNKIGIIS